MTQAVVGRNLPSKKHVAKYIGKHSTLIYSLDAETLAETCFLLGECPRDVNQVVLTIPIADVLEASPWIKNAVRLSQPNFIALTDIHEQVEEVKDVGSYKDLESVKGWEYIRGLSEYLHRHTGVPVSMYGFVSDDDGYRVLRQW